MACKRLKSLGSNSAKLDFFTPSEALLCRRCGYRLYEADAELLLARVMECSVCNTACIDTVDALQKAKSLAQSAYTKADSMHYHLAKLEASQLLEKIKIA